MKAEWKTEIGRTPLKKYEVSFWLYLWNDGKIIRSEQISFKFDKLNEVMMVIKSFWGIIKDD